MPIRDYRLHSILSPQEGLYGGGRRPMPFSFGQQEPDPVDFQAPIAPPQRSESSRFYDEMERIRNMPTPGLTAYTAALQNMPQPEQYKPNWLTRIASGLSGFSAGMRDAGQGVQVAMGLNRAPYDRAMEDYSNRLSGLKEQATMEEADRRNKLKAISDAQELGLKYAEFEQKRADSEENRRNQRITADAARTRAEAYARSLNLPNYSKEPQEDGSLLLINMKNPTDRVVIPAQTVASGQLKVARTNAQTGRLNAETSRWNASTADAAQNMTAKNIRSQINTREAIVQNWLPPSADKEARDLAADSMYNDPQWRPFLEDGVTPDDFTPEAWSLFKEEMDRRTRENTSKRKR